MLSEYRTISEAAKGTYLTETKIRREVVAGRIQGQKVGTVWLIPTEEASRLEHEYPLGALTVAS